MASLPQKSIKGAVFKTWAIQSIDKLIDYLSGTFIRGGKGIAVRRSAGVTIIELEKQPEQVQQSAGGGGGGGTNQDISATVSGGTAFIGLSGSTATAEIVGTGDVTISGNTAGQIEINATGGGGSSSVCVPDYFHPIVDRTGVEMRTNYGPYTGTAYLIGNVASVVIDGELYGDLFVDFISGGSMTRVYLASFSYPSASISDAIEVPVSIVIPSGTTISLGSVTEDPQIGGLAIYPSFGGTLADYTVTRATGTTNGSLFFGLSQQGDNTVSIDSSLNGTPLDFEGASVL